MTILRSTFVMVERENNNIIGRQRDKDGEERIFKSSVVRVTRVVSFTIQYRERTSLKRLPQVRVNLIFSFRNGLDVRDVPTQRTMKLSVSYVEDGVPRTQMTNKRVTTKPHVRMTEHPLNNLTALNTIDQHLVTIDLQSVSPS